jgi:hypothetical protein
VTTVRSNSVVSCVNSTLDGTNRTTAIEYVPDKIEKKQGGKLTGLRRDFGAGPPKEKERIKSMTLINVRYGIPQLITIQLCTVASSIYTIYNGWCAGPDWPAGKYQERCEGVVYSWYPETSGVVDGTLEGDAGDEDAVGSIDSVAFADVQAQRLAGPLDDFHKMYRILWILQKEKEKETGHYNHTRGFKAKIK